MDYALLSTQHLLEAHVRYLRATLLRLGYGVSTQGPRGLLVANLGPDERFQERLVKLARHFSIGVEDAVGMDPRLGELRTYNREGVNARQVITSWAREVMQAAGIA